ncbi:hypothetical protein ACD661_16545 [Legionella lytica]|uniref:Uncharacterized protein n=1 Tax=Legionella lytica TaxID=96232 RepID=A0ABW8DDU3_9GAMM
MSVTHLLESIIKIRKQLGTCTDGSESLSEELQQINQEKFKSNCALAFTKLIELEKSLISEYGERGAQFLQITLQELNFPETLQKQIACETKLGFNLPSTLSEKILPLCEMAYQNEKNGVPSEHANKLAKIFEKYQDIFDYLIKFRTQNTFEHLIHDACLFELPDAEGCAFEVWKKLAHAHLVNPNFRELLPHATEIEVFCMTENKQQKNIKTNQKAINDKIKEITSTSKVYKKLQTNPSPAQQAKRDEELANLSIKSVRLSHELAELCKGIPLKNCNITILDAFYKEYQRECKDHQILVKYGISKASIRKFSQLTPGNDDVLIPDVFIKIPNHENLYLKKLDVLHKEGAALAACLGKITDCCQYIGGAGSSCAEYGISSPHSGFYVVCRGNPDYPALNDEIVAQSWVWRSKDNALVFDSIEMSKNKSQFPVMPFFNQLIEQLIAEGHTHKVACGSGSGIAKRQGVTDESTVSEEFFDYVGYSDARRQRILADVNKPFLFYKFEDQTQSLIKELMKSDTPFNENRVLKELTSYLLLNKKNLLGFIYEALSELSLTDKKVTLDEMFANILSTSGFLYEIDNIQWLLSVLPHENTIIFEPIKNNFPNIIKNRTHFCTLFNLLPLQQQGELFNLTQENLPGIIKDKYKLDELFAPLSLDNRVVLFDLLKSNFPNTIKNTSHFCKLFSLLPLQQQCELFNLTKENLPEIIKDQYELNEVFAPISLDQRTALLGRLKNKLPGFITDEHGLIIVFKHLNPAQQVEVLHILKDTLSKFLTAEGAVRALKGLSPEEITLLDTVIKDISSQIIKTEEDFNRILELPSEKCRAFLSSIKNSFPYIIKNGKQLNTVIGLFPEQHTDILEMMQESLRNLNLIKTCDEFTEIFKELSCDNRLAFFHSLKEKLPFLIKNMNDFEAMQASLSFISTEPLKTLLEVIGNNLYYCIRNHDDFIKMLNYLSPEQHYALCERMQNFLYKIVNPTDGLHAVLHYFTPEQILNMCNSLKYSQPEIIKTSDDFSLLLRHVPQGEIINAYSKIKFSLLGLLKNSDDLAIILAPLPLEPMKLICKDLGRTIPYLVNKNNDITSLFQPLSPQQITVVGEFLKENLHKIVNNSQKFIAVITFLKPDQIMSFCELITKNMPRIIKDEIDLINVFKDLTSEQIKAVCTIHKEYLRKIIKSPTVLKTIRANTSGEKADILNGLIDCSNSANKFSRNPYSFFLEEMQEIDSSKGVNPASLKTSASTKLLN